ncbi:MAG: hypothetical protein JXB05_03990 [Myxococcaceae bacterium]|nr:hypothetical protein [Myxococcaceae bacterium]
MALGESGMMAIYELVSTSGAMAAFAVFLSLSLGISMVLYALLVRSASRRAPFHGESAIRVPVAALVSTVTFGLLFGALYATTLRGFHRVELLEDQVRLYYLFPAHTVTLPRLELTQAERGRGHLRLRTHEGATYQSALANERAVLETWEGLNAYLGCAARP